jgi:hypothetical protein
MKTALAHLHEPLDTVIAVALCGGVAIYLLSLDAIRFRDARSVNRRRIAAALVSAALIPLAVGVDALAALAAVAAVPATFVAYEAIRFRERRAELRAAT